MDFSHHPSPLGPVLSRIEEVFNGPMPSLMLSSHIFLGLPQYKFTIIHIARLRNKIAVCVHIKYGHIGIAMICATKSRTGNYDFRACARALGFPGSTRFGRTHTPRRVCRTLSTDFRSITMSPEDEMVGIILLVIWY